MVKTQHYSLQVAPGEKGLWSYTAAGRTYDLAGPEFQIDGQRVEAMVRAAKAEPVRRITPEIEEHIYRGSVVGDEDLELTIVFRVAVQSPVVRFRYELSSRRGRRLTKTSGKDALSYGGVSLAEFADVKEVRFSEFQELLHSYQLSELPVDFAHEIAVMGPMVAASGGGHSLLLAYEHGSQAPDAFVRFETRADRSVRLQAVKGNYLDGQTIAGDMPFRSIWFELAAVAGDETALAAAYRQFVLKYFSTSAESRKPYIFYNSWNFQERNQWWNRGTPTTDMNEQRMLAEIEVAHRMGVEVFVLDAGWEQFDGDWNVHPERFPRGLKPIRQLLDRYGMKLGLWFCNWASAGGQMLSRYRDCVMSWRGKPAAPKGQGPDGKYKMCLASGYGQAFADRLIELARAEGVRYFKWDAMDQRGCDEAGHDHGSAEQSPEDRGENYAFQQVLAMQRIADKVTGTFPDAIVDFDVTEPGRGVGLAFLASGKYFLVNNGPYFTSYNIPYDWPTGKLFDSEPTRWSNIFVYPGPARGWVCRTPLNFDKWIPSVLFLTHYLPDDPEQSQLINIASLILGQNGIWGDLPTISQEGVERFGKWLGIYKRVRQEITEATAHVLGVPGGSPEIHEKISANGKGVVCMFASAAGSYQYVTRGRPARSFAAVDGLEVAFEGEAAKLTATFEQAGAKFVFFGV